MEKYKWNLEKRLRHTSGDWKTVATFPSKTIICSTTELGLMVEIAMNHHDLTNAANVSLIATAPKLAWQHQKDLNALVDMLNGELPDNIRSKIQIMADEKNELLNRLI